MALSIVSSTADAMGPLRVDHNATIGTYGACFATAVVPFANQIAVGIPGDDSTGAVALYNAKTFELKRLLGATHPQQYDHFGQTLAAHRRRLFVGVPGLGEVHEFDAAGMLRSVIISPERPEDFVVPEPGEFGSALAASRGRLAVVSRGLPPMLRAYDMADGAMIWARSLPSECEGIGIAAKGRYVAVGGGCVRGGTRRVAVFDIRTGVEVLEVPPPETGIAERFGSTVALLTGVLVVGAPGFENGAAFAFEVPSGRLLKTYRPAAENVSEWQWFGHTVAVSRRWVAVSDAYYRGIGAVHLFDRKTGASVAFVPYPIDTGLYGHTLGFVRNRLLVGSQGCPGEGYVDVVRIRR